ncbi:CPBP family intramembrane metalloprotease [Actinoallomurus purpureus]|uniref:CPBP family intramembrane glutamic endopeptidase n=1 Tax=Actinoallomurus purpureus TaxID=478114 RepID=UPI0020939A64|nr:CPBP family intramembrane glutamic endopeptidase [Actinoallomurus purpureus]MCO6011055.1 CPBP family intramembrane metalloprotease [Actinoallomurus purpureus]
MKFDDVVGLLTITTVSVCAVAAIGTRWKKRVPLGLGVRHGAVSELTTGLVIGTSVMTLLSSALLAAGRGRVEHIGIDVERLGLGFLVLAVAALGEEVVYRSLLLTGLIVLVRRPVVALALSAALFGLVHLTGSPDATAISLLSNAMGGVMYGVAFLRTGRIWMPVGVHFAWNFVQGTLFGFPISDETAYSGAILHLRIDQHDRWLGGGAYGPEGSILSLLARGAIIVLILLATRDRNPGIGRVEDREVKTER